MLAKYQSEEMHKQSMQEILTKEALKKKKRRKEDTKILNQLIVR